MCVYFGQRGIQKEFFNCCGIGVDESIPSTLIWIMPSKHIGHFCFDWQGLILAVSTSFLSTLFPVKAFRRHRIIEFYLH